MAFFVVLRRADAALSIPLPEAYPTREAAIAALSAASASGSVVLDGEVFIADLSAAVPVLIMQPVAPVLAPVEQQDEVSAEESLDEAPVAIDEIEPDVLDEVEAEIAYVEYSPLAELADESALAAALKRAATSLEEEGIVAPESIEAAPADPLDDALEPAVAEPESESEEPAGWPWANVEPVEAATEDSVADDADDSALDEETVVVLIEEEPDVVLDSEPLGGAEPVESADASLITSAPAEGEEAYLPRPVILGDYADDAPMALEPAEPLGVAEEQSAEETETGLDDMAIEIVLEEIEEIEEPAVSPVVEPEAAPDDDLSALVAEATGIGGYEGGGELNLAEYTCQDCIYANTCPKVGESTPATCGAFQWKSQ
jgi:hypothetical protein